MLIVPYSSGELYALSTADGKEIWSDSLLLNTQTQAGNVFSGIGGDPVIDGEVVFAVSSSGTLSVYGLVQGQAVWERPVSSTNTPWVTGDYMYLLSTENTLICFVKYTGAVRWATTIQSFEDEEDKKRPISWRGPVMVGGKLALVGSRGQMLLISAQDGKVTDTKSIPDDVYTSPVVAGGRMYLISQDATLYSLQ
jgi:outer membrane protein assembly factor BamB